MGVTLQLHLSVLTKSTHVESRFCGRSRQVKAAFCTPVNPCVRSVCSRSVVVGIESLCQPFRNGVERAGIRLRRDNWVSVRYAEALNSGKSSVTLQRTDRHGILDQKRADFQESL